MPDESIFPEPRPPQSAPRNDTAPTPNVSDGAQWSSVDPSVPKWPLFYIPVLTLALGMIILVLPSGPVLSAVHAVGLGNAFWILGAVVPLIALLWIAANRLLRCAAAADRMLRSAYYIAWSSVSSWKPDIREAGWATLVKLDGRRKEMTESLRHLKWGLWGFAVICLLGAAFIAFSTYHGTIAPSRAVRAETIVIIVTLATLVVAYRLAARTRALSPTDAEIQRAASLQAQCNDERERWRRSPFGSITPQ